MSQEKRVIFRCSDRLYQQLARVAKAQEVTVSEVSRLAAENYVSQTPQESNIIPFAGVITGGKDDLAIWEAIKAEFVQSKAEFHQEVEDLAA